MQVRAARAAAWIVESNSPDDPGRHVRVYAAGRTGPVSVLDEGTDVGPESLTLSGRTLTWWHAGMLRSAPLPG